MDKDKCYELFKENISHAFNEITQLGENITGKTHQEFRFQSLEQFTDMGEEYKKLFDKYLTKYEAFAKKMDVDIVQDKLI